MKIGVAAESGEGVEADVSRHFGRCPYYVIVKADEEKVKEPVKVIPNPYATAHENCGQVPTFLKEQGIDVIIAGGMGSRAMGFFDQFGIQVVTGAAGKVKENIDRFLKGELKSNEPCH